MNCFSSFQAILTIDFPYLVRNKTLVFVASNNYLIYNNIDRSLIFIFDDNLKVFLTNLEPFKIFMSGFSSKSFELF